MQNVSFEAGENHFPSYYSIQKAKAECYPEVSSIHVTEREAYIKLQCLLDHTVNRLLRTLEANVELKSSGKK